MNNVQRMIWKRMPLKLFLMQVSLVAWCMHKYVQDLILPSLLMFLVDIY